MNVTRSAPGLAPACGRRFCIVAIAFLIGAIGCRGEAPGEAAPASEEPAEVGAPSETQAPAEAGPDDGYDYPVPAEPTPAPDYKYEYPETVEAGAPPPQETPPPWQAAEPPLASPPPPPPPPSPSPRPGASAAQAASAPASAGPPPAIAHWNSWMEKDCSRVLNWFGCDYVDTVEREKRYLFRLTVSAQPLARASAAGSQRLGEVIEGANAQAPDEVLTLNVVPILTEGHIRLPPGAPRIYPLEIDPRKFQRHDLLPAETTKEEINRALELSAGDVVIPLDISDTAAACSHIMLSVWDAQLRKPLDSLIVPVAVRTPESANRGCESGFGAELMRGGADSLVAYGGGEPAGAAGATVGLHTFDFEIGGEMRSFAVFAARDANQDHIYGWEMESVLHGRIGRAAALPERVREARKVLLNPGATADQRKRAYETAAEVLRSSIFAAKGGRGAGEDAAQAALALFKKIASDNPEPLTVYARFTVAGSDLYYSPLGLLSANQKVLGKKLRVIQPLPVRNSPDPPCIDSWTIAGSTELLAGVEDPSAKAALEWMLDKESRPAWVREKIHEAARLKSFLAGEGQSLDPAGPTEGVLLLAHHSTDRGFWFGPNDPPILVEDLKRTYAPGSAMVLGACSTAGPLAADDTLERLNSFGVDGMIVSPFPVDAAYTIRLAREIVRALGDAYSEGREATIAEIFGTALNNTAQSYNKEERYAHTEQVGLEYVLAGDPGLKLCKHQPGQPVAPPEPPTP